MEESHEASPEIQKFDRTCRLVPHGVTATTGTEFASPYPRSGPSRWSHTQAYGCQPLLLAFAFIAIFFTTRHDNH